MAFYENPDDIFIRFRTSGKIYNIHRLFARTKVPSTLVRELLYADDFDIVTHLKEEMKRFMNRFSHVYNDFGLEIILKKIVALHNPVPGLPDTQPGIYVERKKLDVVHSFVYLGSTLIKECSFDNEIICALKKLLDHFRVLKNVFIPCITSNSKQRSCSIKHMLCCPSCMQVKRGRCISTYEELLNVSINDACNKYFAMDGNPTSQIQMY